MELASVSEPLISVHVAKAGGSSLLKMFQARFGDRMIADYAENPADPLSPRVVDPARYMTRQIRIPSGIDCVHGHFHPGKYVIPRNAVLSTILRHPVDNLISIYFFWKRLEAGHDPLHDYFLAQNLSMVETAKLPLLRHLLSETYFGGFDMARFNVIGCHNRRNEAIQKLEALIGGTFKNDVRENVTPPTEERQAIECNATLRRALEDVLTEDIRFYERFAR